MEEIANNGDPEKAKIQSVLLLTDGVPCIGVRSIDGILTKMMQIQNPQGEKFPQKVWKLIKPLTQFGLQHVCLA